MLKRKELLDCNDKMNLPFLQYLHQNPKEYTSAHNIFGKG